jgi:3D (Asp-Asp-Asp) domain-containing protein
MPRVLTRSIWLKLAVLLFAIAGFVFLYEVQMFDSRTVAWLPMTTSQGSPLPGSQLPFSATAYCKGTTTASGVDVRTGIAAADRTVLPVGSVLNVAAGDARYTGVYTVMDTGPKVQGRHLDLYMWSCHEALAFGRKPIQVTVLRLGWNPQASTPGVIDRLFRRRERAKADIPPEAPPPPIAVEPPGEVTPDGDGEQGASTPAPAPPALHEVPTSSGSVDSTSAPTPLP